MHPYPLTPSEEEFAPVAAAAILLAYRLIFAIFTDLVTKMPNRIATGFIFVIAGMDVFATLSRLLRKPPSLKTKRFIVLPSNWDWQVMTP